jgi:methanogenic corrinoid protein MtbC1
MKIENTVLKDELIEGMALLDEDKVLVSARALAEQGCSHSEVQDFLNTGVKKVGDLFEKGDYFIADLIVSGMIYRAALSYFRPDFKNTVGIPIGKVIIGVVENDIHDIGKDIVVSVLRAEGFEVIDLGVDVKPVRFVEALKNHKPDILIMSGTMKFAQQSMEQTLKEIEKAGLRNNIAVIIGGACANEVLKKHVNADAYGDEALDALKYCKTVIASKTK